MDHARYVTLSRLVILLSGFSLAKPAFSGHPLLSEDTGTQGQGNSQIELAFEYSDDKAADGVREINRDATLVLSYGISDTFDVMLTLPYSSVSETGLPTVAGVGDVELTASWRFYDNDTLSFAVHPSMTFSTGDENNGLGTGKNTYSVFAVLSYEPDPWGIHLHAGITDNRNTLGEREHITHLSFSITRDVTDNLQLEGDFSHESNTDLAGTHIESILFGLIYAVSEQIDLEIGYRAGISDSAADDTWLLGVAMQF